jgi:hypothetical protein
MEDVDDGGEDPGTIVFALVITVGLTAQAMGLEGVDLGTSNDRQYGGIGPNRGAEGGEQFLANDLTTEVIVAAGNELATQLAGVKGWVHGQAQDLVAFQVSPIRRTSFGG